MTNTISVKGLTKSYNKHSVLKGVNLEVTQGTIFALLGSNGAGKTTTVRILSTLISPDEGTATVGGYDVVKEAKNVRASISLTGQYAAVDDLLTGEENMLMMGRFSHTDPQHIKQHTTELLDRLDLQNAAQHRVKTYSGGMRRRLDLAISLLSSAKIIFLDEPTTGLDPRSRQEIWKIIKGLVADGVTIFLTTQYLEEADQLADKIALIGDGKIVAEGTAEKLKQQIGGERIEIGFGDITACHKAKKILGDHTVVDEITFSLALKTDGSPAFLRKLLNKLADNNIEPDNISLRKPTLDDVFMQLTASNKKENK